MIRVWLVDDQTLVRSGISGLLGMTADIRVIAESANGSEVEAMIGSVEADLMLLDVRMPVCSGIELLHKHAARLPPTILLTTFDDDAALFDGMKAGARGFLLKDISLERLAEGIRSVVSGRSLFRPTLTERMRSSYERTSMAGGQVPTSLTERETEILALMASGFSNAEIAQALGPTEGTIKNYVSSILSKLGVRDRVRAVLRGLEMGFI